MNQSPERLLTKRQREILDAIHKHGGQRTAARALGISRGTVSKAVERAKKKLDMPDLEVDSMAVKGVSVLTDADGNEKLRWTRTEPEVGKQKEVLKAMAEGMADQITKPPILAPKTTSDSLLTAYPIGDHHFGMLAWEPETGEDYDLNIGEDLLNGAINYLVESSPPSDTGLVVFLGDFTHYDSFFAETPTHKNRLDPDSRFPKMVRVATRSARFVIDKALSKHKKVHVIVEIGNHDLATSIFLMELLNVAYENEPRVTIDTSPKHFHFFKFYKNLIGTHHGHGVKLEDLPLLMATDQPKTWGDSIFRYWWTGHVHHTQVKDIKGCSVESFRVLPPTDAWAHQKGFRPYRDMKSIVLHKDFGEVARTSVTPEMLKE